ncbi:hypothetical protein D3C87_1319800 [compost metagenome]
MLMPVGEAPRALNMEVHSGLTSTRSLKPARSCGVKIGRVELVIWRKPLFQTFSIGIRPTLAVLARTYSPSLPSRAAQTLS